MASASRERLVVGVMTGTSIDGIDAALVRLEGRGLRLSAHLLAHEAGPLGDLAARLSAMAAQTPASSADASRLAWDLGQLHAALIARLAEQAARLDLVVVHGQTVFHEPPLSWQLVNAAPIARRCACPVVFDLRQADLAAGGQGAPITPLADWVLFRAAGRRAVVNLGGFCNVTVLPPARQRDPLRAIAGFDVCACNQVLDAVARAALGAPYDEQGRAAARGRAHPRIVDELLEILRTQRAARRSLGSGDDQAREWASRGAATIGGPDLAASAVTAVGRAIGEAVAAHHPGDVVVAGGGAHNLALLESLGASAGVPLLTSDELGIPVAAREAAAIAVLGALCADGVPITLSQVTGCSDPAPVAGSWALPRGLGSCSRGETASR
jgi:1,6-anhydro-N-acetylmuramate kinase